MDASARFYLTEWIPAGDGEVRRLMDFEGGDDGTDAVVAEFSREPSPLGEQLAATALAAANAFEDRNASHFHLGSIVPGDVRIRDYLEDPTARWRFTVVADAVANILNNGKPACALHVEGRAQFDDSEASGEATAEAMRNALENCRKSARAYCDVNNGGV